MANLKYPDDVLKSLVVRGRLRREAKFESARGDDSKGHYWAITALPSTNQIVGCQNFTPSVFDIDPHPVQKQLAEALVRSLNRHVGHDGGWIVGFTHPPSQGNALRTDGDNVWGQLFCLWLDEDGDPQFTYETDRDPAEVVQDGVDYFIKMCDESYWRWEDLLGKKGRKELGLKDGQMIKAAQALG